MKLNEVKAEDYKSHSGVKSSYNSEEHDKIVSFYSQRVENLDGIISEKQKQLSLVSWTRLLCFAVMCTFAYFAFKGNTLIFSVASVLTLFLFAYFINKFNACKVQLKKLKISRKLNKLEIDCLNHNWSGFANGEEYTDTTHDYSYDLDLYGEGSFFQFLNRSATLGGEMLLSQKLSKSEHLDSDKEINNIVDTQNAIKELSSKVDFRQDFYASAKLVEDNKEAHNITKVVTDYKPQFINKKPLFKALKVILPYSFIISLVCYFITAAFDLSVSSIFSKIAIYSFLANLAFMSAYLKQINSAASLFSNLSKHLKKYSLLISKIENEEFSASLLKQIKSDIEQNSSTGNDKDKASYRIKKFSGYLQNLDQRSNPFAAIILNGISQWDLRYICKMEQWIVSNSESLTNWFNAIYQIDSLNSMANFVHNNPSYCFPTFSNTVVFDAHELGHPLIKPNKLVRNSFNLNQYNFAMITGANMSGKSTFLRSVAFARVMAQSGLPVCATSLVIKPLRLITNMRTSDNLLEDESYFFAELKRLKYIIDSLYDGSKLFIILDEILKGTNSKDKTNGSIQLMLHLLELNSHGLIATHDIELGKLEDETEKMIQNICFEVRNENNRLEFDYKLHKGVTKNHNASFLMKAMNIIKSN